MQAYFYHSLIVQQYEQGGGVSLSKKYLPAVLAVIVANVNRTTNVELVKKAYQATENILTTAAFNGMTLELRGIIRIFQRFHMGSKFRGIQIFVDFMVACYPQK